MEQKAEDKIKMNKKPQDINSKSISKKKNKMIKRKRHRERDFEKEETKTDSEKINRKNVYIFTDNNQTYKIKFLQSPLLI